MRGGFHSGMTSTGLNERSPGSVAALSRTFSFATVPDFSARSPAGYQSGGVSASFSMLTEAHSHPSAPPAWDLLRADFYLELRPLSLVGATFGGKAAFLGRGAESPSWPLMDRLPMLVGKAKAPLLDRVG